MKELLNSDSITLDDIHTIMGIIKKVDNSSISTGADKILDTLYGELLNATKQK